MSTILVHTYDGGLKTFTYNLDLITVQQLKAIMVSGILSNVAVIGGALQKLILARNQKDDSARLFGAIESRIDVQNVKLIHEGKPLDDDSAPLSKYGAKSRFEVQMVRKVHGG